MHSIYSPFMVLHPATPNPVAASSGRNTTPLETLKLHGLSERNWDFVRTYGIIRGSEDRGHRSTERPRIPIPHTYGRRCSRPSAPLTLCRQIAQLSNGRMGRGRSTFTTFVLAPKCIGWFLNQCAFTRDSFQLLTKCRMPQSKKLIAVWYCPACLVTDSFDVGRNRRRRLWRLPISKTERRGETDRESVLVASPSRLHSGERDNNTTNGEKLADGYCGLEIGTWFQRCQTKYTYICCII